MKSSSSIILVLVRVLTLIFYTSNYYCCNAIQIPHDYFLDDDLINYYVPPQKMKKENAKYKCAFENHIDASDPRSDHGKSQSKISKTKSKRDVDEEGSPNNEAHNYAILFKAKGDGNDGLSDRSGLESRADNYEIDYGDDAAAVVSRRSSFDQCDTSLDAEKPLLCYQCKSNTHHQTSGDDDLCDNDLWKYLLEDKLDQFRFRCPNGHGTYCVKKVQTKHGVQITERGCFGPGPAKAGDGSPIQLQNGCVTYKQNGFLTTTCLCTSELCNSTPPCSTARIMNQLIMLLLLMILPV